jgi:hypothetical protein
MVVGLVGLMSRLSSSIARLMMAGGASFGSLSLNKVLHNSEVWLTQKESMTV